MNQLTLNSAIMSFAFSGVLAPHKREYETPRTVFTTTTAVPKKK